MYMNINIYIFTYRIYIYTERIDSWLPTSNETENRVCYISIWSHTWIERPLF